MAPNNSCSSRKPPPSIDASFLLAPRVGSHLQLTFYKVGCSQDRTTCKWLRREGASGGSLSWGAQDRPPAVRDMNMTGLMQVVTATPRKRKAPSLEDSFRTAGVLLLPSLPHPQSGALTELAKVAGWQASGPAPAPASTVVICLHSAFLHWYWGSGLRFLSLCMYTHLYVCALTCAHTHRYTHFMVQTVSLKWTPVCYLCLC